VVYALIAVAWVALWTASRQWTYMVPMALVFGAHPFLKNRVRLNVGIVGYGLLLLGAGVLYKLTVTPLTGVVGNRFHYSFYISFLALIYAALKLYSAPDRTRLPRIILFTAVACGFVAVGLPDDVGLDPRWTATSVLGPFTPAPERFYVLVTATYGLLALVALRRTTRVRRRDAAVSRTGLRVGLVVSTAILAGSTAGMVWVEKTYYQEVANLYTKMLTGSGGGGGGFSDGAKLGSVVRAQQTDGGVVALRVFAERAPGYLRGKAFGDYTGKSWSESWDSKQVAAVDGVFAFAGEAAPEHGAPPFLRVHPDPKYDTQFFLPLDASAVATGAGEVQLHGPGRTLRRTAGQPIAYAAFLGEPVHVDAEHPLYLRAPKDPVLVGVLDATLADLGLEAGVATDHAVAVISGQFRMGFSYRVGVKFKRGSDPLTQFLGPSSKRVGHCELFASSGALLLRRLGIPARYVTGFLCEESNPLDAGLFLARNRHAHAWVEFYDRATGWQVAEFTPPAGVPDQTSDSGFAAFLSYLGGLWERAKAVLSDLPGAISSATKAAADWLVASWWRVLGVVLALCVFFFARARLGTESSQELTRERQLPPELAAKRTRYVKVEARLRKVGLGRREWETVLEYAGRLATETLPDDLSAPETLSFLRAFAFERYGAKSTS
jgi:hypothetical protein